MALGLDQRHFRLPRLRQRKSHATLDSVYGASLASEYVSRSRKLHLDPNFCPEVRFVENLAAVDGETEKA